jgi:hypothetical protein
VDRKTSRPLLSPASEQKIIWNISGSLTPINTLDATKLPPDILLVIFSVDDEAHGGTNAVIVGKSTNTPAEIF